MKTKTWWILAVFLIAAIRWGCDRDAFSLSVSPESVTITDPQSHPLLTAAVLTADGEEVAISDVKWLSSDTSVVSVDKDGRLTAHGNGAAVIRVKNRSDEKEVAVTVRLSESE